MVTKIRLARGGAKKRPFYRIVAADIRAPRDGKFIEKLGTFNPLLAKDNEQRVILNKERIEHWLTTGAQPTERVAKLLTDAGIQTATTKKIARKNKAIEAKKVEHEKIKKEKEAEAKKQAAEEAQRKAEEEAAAAAEAEAAKAAEAAEAEAAAQAEEAAPAEENTNTEEEAKSDDAA